MTATAPVSEAGLKSALAAAAARTDQFLELYVASLKESPAKLSECIRYSLFGPGKRVRPVLAQLCCEALGGSAEQALPGGAAIELIHCFSLVHDDLPAMDNDDLRRGRPTNHKVYGDAMAILAGDAMNTMAFELIVKQTADPALAAKLVLELAYATGPEGMIGGQVLDTCHPEEARSGASATLGDLQRIHKMKTGALLRAACRMGALSAGATEQQLELMDRYGKAIGLAFQIVDDILDVTATEEQMGKKTGKDAAIGKLTYPSLIGLEKAREHLHQQTTAAESVCDALGSRGDLLRAFAHNLATRSN